MSIIEKNQMLVSTAVVTPPRQLVEVYPVKDAYLDQENAFFPFGSYNTLEVRYAKDKELKSIMTFDIASEHLNAENWNNLISANLTLYAATIPKTDIHLLLKYHQDDGWPENGTTWVGQPLEYPENILKFTFPARSKSVTLDLLTVFKLNGYDYTKYAFSIVGDPEYGERADILNISSKESSKKPTLAYCYEYFPDNYDRGDMETILKVRRSTDAVLKTKLKIKKGLREDNLPLKLTVKSYANNADLTAKIHPNPLVYDTKFKIDSIIRRSDNEDLLLKAAVKKYLGNADLNSKIDIKGYQDSNDIDTFIKVLARAYLPVSIKVNKYNINDDVMTKLAIKKDVTGDDAPSFPAKLHVKSYNNTDELMATIVPRYNGSADLNALLKVNNYADSKDLTVSLKAKPHDEIYLATNLTVRGFADDSQLAVKQIVKARQEIPVNITTRKVDNKEFNANMKVRPWWAKDVVVNIKTLKNSAYSYAFIL